MIYNIYGLVSPIEGIQGYFGKVERLNTRDYGKEKKQDIRAAEEVL